MSKQQMIDTRGPHGKGQNKAGSVDYESSSNSEDFQDYEQFPGEDDDTNRNTEISFSEVDFECYRQDGMNQMKDLMLDQFANDAQEFMKAVGEDNIFMSGLEWLPSQDSDSKRKIVRKSIDEIMFQVFDVQVEVNKSIIHNQNIYRNVYQHSERFKFWSETLKNAEQCKNRMRCFLETIRDDLKYLEKQVQQVDICLMSILKTPIDLIQPQKSNQTFGGRNMFYEYIKKNGEQSEKGLIEFLKRVVFKLAVVMERYSYFKLENKNINFFNKVPQKNGEIKHGEINARDSGLVKLVQPEREQKFDEQTSKAKKDQIYDQLRDFHLRKCISRQILALNDATFFSENRPLIEPSKKNHIYHQEKEEEPSVKLTDVDPAPVQARVVLSNPADPIKSLSLSLQNLGVNPDPVLCINMAKEVKQRQFTNEEIKKAVNQIMAPANDRVNEESKDVQPGQGPLSLHLNKIVSTIVKVNALAEGVEDVFTKQFTNQDKTAIFQAISPIVQILYYLQQRMNELKTKTTTHDESLPMHNILAFLNNIKEDFKWNKEAQEKARQEKEDMEQSDVIEEVVEDDQEEKKVIAPEEKQEQQKEDKKKAEEQKIEDKKNAEEQKKEVKKKAELRKQNQTKKFFLAQIWIQNLLPLLEFFIDIKLFDDSYTSHVMVDEFALLIEATFDKKYTNIQLLSEENYVKQAKENGYAGEKAKQMSNLCRSSILKIIDIFDSNQLFRLTPSKQVAMVKQFWVYYNNSIQDLRLRKDRCCILKGIFEVLGNDQEASRIEAEFARETYKFLFAYFKWNGAFDRTIRRRVNASDDKIEGDKIDLRKLILQDSDKFVKWLFYIRNPINDAQNLPPKDSKPIRKPITDEIELYTMVMFQLLLKFDRETIRMLVAVQPKKDDSNQRSGKSMAPKSTRKNLFEMLKVMQQNFKEEIEFNDPFKQHCLKIRFNLLIDFCQNLSEELLKENKIKALVKEFRPHFAYTWIIMLQNYIHKRQEEVEDKENFQENEKDYKNRSGKLMQSILRFWAQTKIYMKNATDGKLIILMPSKSLVHDLRVNYIPKLVEFVKDELDDYRNTLFDVLQFLFLYDEITYSTKQTDPDDAKLIDMLPILVNISEKLLNNKNQNSKKYQLYALQFNKWLRCSKDVNSIISCEECKANKAHKQLDENYTQSLILQLIVLAFRKIIEDQDDGFYCSLDTENPYNLILYAEQMMDKFKDLEKRIFFMHMSTKHYKDTDEETKQMQEKTKDKYRIREDLIKKQLTDTDVVLWKKDKIKKLEGKLDRNVDRQTISDAIQAYTDLKMGDIHHTNQNRQFEKVVERLFPQKGGKPGESDFFTELPPSFLIDKTRIQNLRNNNNVDPKFYEVIKKDENQDGQGEDAQETDQEVSGDMQNEVRIPKSSQITEQDRKKYEVYCNLPDEIQKANEEWRNKILKYDVEVRPEDKVYQAYCHYMLLKMKCKYDIYQKIEYVLKDTLKCQELLKAAQTDYKLDEEEKDDDSDSDSDDVKIETFMTAEIPFLMHETILWINERIQTKKNDKIFMENFLETPARGNEIKDITLEKATEQVIKELRTFDGSDYNDKAYTADGNAKAKNNEAQSGFYTNGFYPIESFQVKQRQITQLINQSKIFPKEHKTDSVVEEINMTKEHLNEMQRITDQIADFKEKDLLDSMSNLPNYCTYIHLQFWGEMFAPELSYNPLGIVVRRKKGTDLKVLTHELNKLYPEAQFKKKGKGKVISRENLNSLPELKKEYGYDDVLSHNQKIPLIVVCFDLEFMTQEMINLYKKGGEHAIELQDNQIANNRRNFKSFFQQNYKKYLTKVTREKNDLMETQCENIIKNELMIWKIGTSLDDSFIYLKDWERELGKRFQAMTGDQPEDIQKIWKDMAKFEIQKDHDDDHERLEKEQNKVLQKKTPDMSKADKTQKLKYKTVFDRLKNIVMLIADYKNSVLTILEMPNQFPTGFFFQEVKQKISWKIVGTRFTNNKMKKFISKTDKKLKAYDKAVEETPSIDVQKFARQIFEQAQLQFASDVGGGPAFQMLRFFPDNGFYQVDRKAKYKPTSPIDVEAQQRYKDHDQEIVLLDLKNEDEIEFIKSQYHELLKIFKSLDETFKKLQCCLDCMNKYIKIQPTDVSQENGKTYVVDALAINVYQGKLDKWVQQLEVIRDKHQIDDKMAQERDQMHDSEDED